MSRFSKFVILILFLVAGIAPMSHASPEANAPRFTVRWGVILPLSGPVARSGVDIRRGFEMAAEDLNSSDIHHEFFFEDSEYSSKIAVSAAQKLVAVNKVDVLVGLWDTADPIAPLADRLNVLHTSIRWNNDIAASFKNTFTFESTYKDYADATISLLKNKGMKSVAIMGMDSSGWNLTRDVMIEVAKRCGVKVTRLRPISQARRIFETSFPKF